MSDNAVQTPLTDLMSRIPFDAIYQWTEPDGLRASCSAPVGRYCHEAVDMIAALRAERDEAVAKRDAPRPASARLFDAGFAQSEIEDQLETWIGEDYCGITWDWYDQSVEVLGVVPGTRLCDEARQWLANEGFARAWMNYDDGTQRYYQFKPEHTESDVQPGIRPAEWTARQAEKRGRIARIAAERDAAQAEVARLREALEHLIERADTSDDCQYGTLSTSYVRDIARAALESKT